MKKQNRLNRLRPNIFYGWYIVIGLGTVGMVSTGMGGINLGLFLPPMCEELGISNAHFGWAYSARLIGFSITSWYLGVLLDRYGARMPMLVAGMISGLIMIGLSHLQAGWQLVALYFILGMIGLQGGGGNLYQAVPLSRWFVLKRGQAMSMALVGNTVGIFIFTPLSEFFIATTGWRSAWFILGCSGSLVVVMVALLVIHKEPQSMGLLPDGLVLDRHNEININGVRPAVGQEYSWSRAKAIRSFTFWALVFSHGLRMLAVSTLHVFRIPFYIEQGIASNLVAWAISAEAIVAAAVSLIVGRIADRVQPRFVVASALGFFALMLIVTMNVSTTWHVYLSAALYGISATSYIIGQNTLWPAYFGSAHIGSIRGVSLIMTLIFSTIGAPISGAIKDATGSYIPAWIGALILVSIAMGLILITKKPQPQIDNYSKAETDQPNPIGSPIG
ncbi:MAG: MFS transporter [Deltaproteobacteria bacterium]|nr:MFS transporter [Deltaproteobacteria bacterium]